MKKIQLGGRRGPIQGYALVDNEDFERINKHKWCVAKNHNKFYANSRDSAQKTLKMHRVILKLKFGDKIIVDHMDGDGLNNQKSNLRIVTNSQNQMNRGKPINNTSGFKGVSWYKRDKRWKASIKINGKTYHLGFSKSKKYAYKLYCDANAKVHKSFGKIK